MCQPSPLPGGVPRGLGSRNRGSSKSHPGTWKSQPLDISLDINPINPLQAGCLSVQGLSEPGTTRRVLEQGLFSPSLEIQVWAGGSSQGPLLARQTRSRGPSVHVCVLISSCKDIGHSGRGPTWPHLPLSPPSRLHLPIVTFWKPVTSTYEPEPGVTQQAQAEPIRAEYSS